MKKNCCIFTILAFAAVVSTFAIDAKGEAPTFKTDDPAYNAAVDELNAGLSAAFNEVLNGINGKIGGISLKPEKFIRAWGNSSVYASQGATHRGYAGYKTVNVTAGAMVGLQLPGSFSSLIKDFKGLSDNIMAEGDVMLGINPQPINIDVGINTEKFIIKNLYLGFKLGFFTLNSIKGINFITGSIGFTANYQIIPTVDLANLVKWRGLNVGAGIIYQGTKIGISVPLDPYSQFLSLAAPYQGVLGTPSLVMNPNLTLGLNVHTFTIPLEVVTSIKLIVFNFHAGVGANISFGKSKLDFGMNSNIDIEGLNTSKVTQNKSGSISINESAAFAPYPLSLKIMTGFGINAGPVIFDFPFNIHFGGITRDKWATGYSLGVTMGASI